MAINIDPNRLEEIKKERAAAEAKESRERSQKYARGALAHLPGLKNRQSSSADPVERTQEELHRKRRQQITEGTEMAMPRATVEDVKTETPNATTSTVSTPPVTPVTTAPTEEVDEYKDPLLFGSSYFKDATAEYYATATPADQEEKSLFESPAFQKTALTFGLSLLMGGSMEDAVYNAGEAYARDVYRDTDDYKRIRGVGVPDYIITDAYISGDATQMNDMYKTMYSAQAEANKLREAQLNPAMNDGQKKLYGNILDRYKVLETANSEMANHNQVALNTLKILDSGKNISPYDTIGLINSFQRVIDPKGTVKEGDVNLLLSQMGLGDQVVKALSKVVSFKDGTFHIIGNVPNYGVEFNRTIADSLTKRVQTQTQTNIRQIQGLTNEAQAAQINPNLYAWNYGSVMPNVSPRVQQLFGGK